MSSAEKYGVFFRPESPRRHCSERSHSGVEGLVSSHDATIATPVVESVDYAVFKGFGADG
jgi:hypothetical protein